MSQPNKKGFFGKFGGAYVPDTLMPALIELESFFKELEEIYLLEKNSKIEVNKIKKLPNARNIISILYGNSFGKK